MIFGVMPDILGSTVDVGPSLRSKKKCTNIECWLGGFVIFQVSRTRITKKPSFFVNVNPFNSTPEKGLGKQCCHLVR